MPLKSGTFNYRVWAKARYHQAIVDGLCPECRKPNDSKFKYCEICRAKKLKNEHHHRNKNYWARLIRKLREDYQRAEKYFEGSQFHYDQDSILALVDVLTELTRLDTIRQKTQKNGRTHSPVSEG